MQGALRADFEAMESLVSEALRQLGGGTADGEGETDGDGEADPEGEEVQPRSRLQHAVGHDTSLFSRLVLGCIETKFCNQIRIFSGFSRSTKLSS